MSISPTPPPTLQRVGATRSGLRARLFGLNNEDVLDETYHKAGKMDSDLFSTPLVSEQTDWSR